jgi:hypothetical protein
LHKGVVLTEGTCNGAISSRTTLSPCLTEKHNTRKPVTRCTNDAAKQQRVTGLATENERANFLL